MIRMNQTFQHSEWESLKWIDSLGWIDSWESTSIYSTTYERIWDEKINCDDLIH